MRSRCYTQKLPLAQRLCTSKDMHLTDYTKMLVVMDEGIGNMLDLTPALRVLKELHPGLEITVFGRYPALDVVKWTPFVEEVLDGDPLDQYDIGFFALCYNNTAKQYQTEIVSHCDELYTLDYNDSEKPEWWHYLEIPRMFGWEGNKAEPFCAVSECHVRLSREKINIGLADTSAKTEACQRWPYYPELANVLSEQGCQIALLGNDIESFEVDKWPSGVVYLHNLPELTLPQVAYVLLQCDLVVGYDCGLAQMAAVLDVPTMFIYGPTYVPKNYPLGSKVKIVRRELECAPCQFTSRWGKCVDYQCMKQIRVSDVIEQINEFVGG